MEALSDASTRIISREVGGITKRGRRGRCNVKKRRAFSSGTVPLPPSVPHHSLLTLWRSHFLLWWAGSTGEGEASACQLSGAVTAGMMKMIVPLWTYFYRNIFRFWLKWVLRQLTGKCELQRICEGTKKGAARTVQIEHSLESSKNKVLRSALNAASEDEVENCVARIIQEKKINIHKDKEFALKLQICLVQITGYKKLYLTVENLRKCPYNSNNKEHEDQLIELWNLLMPHEKLKARITKQWCDIGFQGDDPKTDFRGMGMLGLTNLLYFSKHYTHEARQILVHSNHPKMGYSYAIVGINLTEMAYSLLKNGSLKTHFYNLVSGVPQLEHFHQLYCYLAYEFDKFWFQEEPESIMFFNQYREKFHEKVKGYLLDYNVVLALKSEK